MTSRGRGGGLRIKKAARGFMCGCGGSKAVSVSDGSDSKRSPAATPPTAVSSSTSTLISTSFGTTTTTDTAEGTRRAAGDKDKVAVETPSSFSPSSYHHGDDIDDEQSGMVESMPSLTALLRQLRELERSVRFLQAAGGAGAVDTASAAAAASMTNVGGAGGGSRRHRRTVSEGGAGRVEESVAVVKESADPLGDFRRSMLQMIVEKEIVGGAGLRELLHRFLSLNSPRHHHLILRAFAEIWEEVFAGHDRAPDFLLLGASQSHRHRNKKLQQTTIRA